MDSWMLLGRLVLLLAAAASAGILLRHFRQNVMVGYILAGLLLGPTGFGLIGSGSQLRELSELGVALLLFSIGLEFSYARLRQIGRVATLGGTAQVVVTVAAIAAIAFWAGLRLAESLVIGFALSMSSTAVVLRVLIDRAELDSPHGRNSLGVLMAQDIAVVPLLLATEILSERISGLTALGEVTFRISASVALAGLLWVMIRFLIPGLLARAALSGSREIPVLVATFSSLGAAWGAHTLGLSPALGAFVAGMLLAESPFAAQIRADLTPLSAVFITIFFSSLGTVVEIPSGKGLAVAAVAAIGLIFLKALVIAPLVWLFQRSVRTALGTAMALSQAGEFTFVLIDFGRQQGLVSAERFQLLLAVSLVTLVATPYLIGAAPAVSAWVLRRIGATHRLTWDLSKPAGRWDRVIVIGFGPAGQEIVAALKTAQVPFLVLDMNPHTVAANRSAIPIELGDATQPEILHHVGMGQSKAVAVTVPDSNIGRLIVEQIKRVAPGVPLIVRARYHQLASGLRAAGAGTLVDEEQVVGSTMAEEVLRQLDRGSERESERSAQRQSLE